MGQYLRDDHRIFNAGNHLGGATAFTAGLDVDIEHPLEAVCLSLSAYTPLFSRYDKVLHRPVEPAVKNKPSDLVNL